MKTVRSGKLVFLTRLFPILLFNIAAFAEGTKQFMPLSTNYGSIQVNDVGRPFALMTNTDSLHRLFFHISSTSETVYFGFSKHSSSSASSGQFRIKDPSGTIVYSATTIPTSGAGHISSYSAAVAGPKIGGVPAGGYTPLSLTPATTGDFYIEFSSSSNQNYRFEYFDLTVVNASNVPINGRLWSYAWDLNTWASANGFSGDFYVYTNEGYVSKVNMNGIQPYGFVTSCNGTGPQNTGDLVVDRRSIDGNYTLPTFKVFLNDPDNSVYPSASAPSITDSVKIVGGNIFYGQPVQFTIGVSAPGTLQLIISINGVSGYQAGTTDVLDVANVVAGMNTIYWDGKDAYGNYPNGGTSIEISSGFSAGVTHLPIYDPETHTNGFIVDRIRPGSGSAPIRWDDSNFSGGTVNISGGSGNGHSWSTNFGDVRTMNTWWNGYEVENQDQFTVTVQTALPIELTSFSVGLNFLLHPVLNWRTAIEKNLDYFILERSGSLDGGAIFTKAGEVKAHGNSSNPHNYFFEDTQPLTGYSYYRLKAFTYDGNIMYVSEIEKIYLKKPAAAIAIFPNPATDKFTVSNLQFPTGTLEIYNVMGEKVYSDKIVNLHEDSQGVISYIIIQTFPRGVYFVKVNDGENVYSQKLVVE